MCDVCNCILGHLDGCPEKIVKYEYYEYCNICNSKIFTGDKIFVNNFDDEIIYCEDCLQNLDFEEILEILVRREKL